MKKGEGTENLPSPNGRGAGGEGGSAVKVQGSELPNQAGPHPNPLPKGEGTSRIRVTVAQGIAGGEEYKVNFRAVRTPPGWMAEWKSKAVEFPAFAVVGATLDEGAVAIAARDDLTVRPEKLSQLTPLDAADKPKYGLADVDTTLAYRYENPKYAAVADCRTDPAAADGPDILLLRLDTDSLNCHYELIYTVEEARTRRLAFLLPEETPESVSITGLDGVMLKEKYPRDFGQPTPLERAAGRGQARPDSAGGRFSAAAAGAGAEGNGIAAGLGRRRGLSVGPGGRRRLRGTRRAGPCRKPGAAESASRRRRTGRRRISARPAFVGGLRVRRRSAADKIDVLRHPGYPIYSAIVEKCELDTNLSPDGQSQTQAKFMLRTKAVYLQVHVPARAELWSAELDGSPLKPQRDGDSVLIGVPAGTSDAAQSCRSSMRRTVGRGVAPRHGHGARPSCCSAPSSGAEAVEVPLADLVWRLHLPSGYDVVAAGGTLVSDDIRHPTPAAMQVAGVLYYLTGGVSGPPLSIFDKNFYLRIVSSQRCKR